MAREDAYVPSVQYDFEIPLAEVTVALADDLAKLAPNGIGNPAPVLAARGAHVLEARAVGAEGQHLKLRLEQDGASLGGIAFGLGGEKAGLAETVDVVFSPGVNEWMGRRSGRMRRQTHCAAWRGGSVCTGVQRARRSVFALSHRRKRAGATAGAGRRAVRTGALGA